MFRPWHEGKPMTYAQELYYSLKDVVRGNPEKFFMNVTTYRDQTVAVFDYALVIPNDFAPRSGLEARGSVFVIDERQDFVELLCLPYEKFFNLHEFDYDTSSQLVATYQERYGVKPHSGIVEELVADGHRVTYLDKRDGSIISFFDWNGELDAKSNSSLTSDYKYEALELVKKDAILHDKIHTVCVMGYTVITEYTSKRPERQIVLPYDEDEIIVTGVRSHSDGSYWSHERIRAYFGEQYTVDTIEYVDPNSYEAEGIEGYIVHFEDLGLRFKLKTQWYLERHRVASLVTPRLVWEFYLDESLDDISLSVPVAQREYFEHYVNVCDNIYRSIVDTAEAFYEENKGLDAKDYFLRLRSMEARNEDERVGHALAGMLYRMGRKEAIHKLKEKLSISRQMASLGITFGSERFEMENSDEAE